MISLAAKIAFWTSGGASAGAAAMPLGSSLAVSPSTIWVVAGLATPYSWPPLPAPDEAVPWSLGWLGVVPPDSAVAVSAMAGAAATAMVNTSIKVVQRGRPRKVQLSLVGLRG